MLSASFFFAKNLKWIETVLAFAHLTHQITPPCDVDLGGHHTVITIVNNAKQHVQVFHKLVLHVMQYTDKNEKNSAQYSPMK